MDSPLAAGELKSPYSTAARGKSKQPQSSRFMQQQLPSCKPILTPKLVISTLLFIFVVFIPIGVLSFSASREVVEIVSQYETDCVPAGSRNDKFGFIQSAEDKTCNRTLNVPKHMKQPIYVYYQLDNFYQNHRRYVKSRSETQLRHGEKKGLITVECRPEERTKDGMPIVPCGLIAWSLFNDTYRFSRNKHPLTLNRRGISWKSDRDTKFGKDVYPNNFQNGTLIGGGRLDPSKPLSEQEDLIVWMRTAALPNFRKLYGRIEEDLQTGDVINVVVENNYNTHSFNGKKKIILTTTSWLRAKNNFLGLAYLAVGGFCFFLAVIFSYIFLIMKPRKLGDTSRFSWNQKPGYD